MKKKILLLKIGQISEVIVLKLKKNLEWIFKKFNIEIELISKEVDLKESFYHSQRRQYNADKIMVEMDQFLCNYNFFRALGVINEDIYSRFYKFIFGCVSGLESNIALISVIRLNENFYNRTENPPLFEKRILREAIHELGHTFGLKHCENYCVMQFSNSLAEADDKPIKFCEDCSKKLEIFFA
ncbi:MAG: archaemetzincin family Zn-dependent metalloprotease [Candidatus Hodarchaeota archaeon]